MKNLQEMQKQVVDLFKKYQSQGTKMWTYETASHDLQYQVGKLSKCVLQLKNYRYRENLNEDEIKENVADELADIMAEVLFISNELNIDFNKAWEKMIESDENKINERS